MSYYKPETKKKFKAETLAHPGIPSQWWVLEIITSWVEGGFGPGGDEGQFVAKLPGFGDCD